MLTPKFKKLFQFLNTVFLIHNNNKLTSQLVAVAVLDDLFGRIVLPLHSTMFLICTLNEKTRSIMVS